MQYIISGMNGYIGSKLKNKLTSCVQYNKNIKPDKKSIFIHLASKSTAEYKDIIESNINYLIEIIDFCEKNSIKKLIFFSAISIYNRQDIYSTSKLLGEQILKESNLKVLVLRLPMVLTQESKNGILNRIVNKLKTNDDVTLFNAGKKFNNFVGVTDIYNFISTYKFKKKFEVVDLATDKSMTLFEIADFMKNYLSSKSKIVAKKSDDSLFSIDLEKVINEYYYKPLKTKKTLKQWLKQRYKHG